MNKPKTKYELIGELRDFILMLTDPNSSSPIREMELENICQHALNGGYCTQDSMPGFFEAEGRFRCGYHLDEDGDSVRGR